MKKLIDYVLSVPYILYFGLLLLVFHVAQVIALRGFGPRAHKKTVDWMNAGISFGWLLTGTIIDFRQRPDLPTDCPLIFVANHQSMFDIPPIIWFLRRYHPIFISKIELARGIPAISYNLRHSGAALIDRKDGKQAIVEIAKLGTRIGQRNESAVIFPEGTRSPNGVLKPFAVAGVSVLLKKAPGALVVPIAVRGTGRFAPRGPFPLTAFSRLRWTVLPPIDPRGQSAEAVVQQARAAIETVLTGGATVLSGQPT